MQPEYAAPTPDVTESEAGENFRVVDLEALVRMKLTSFRRKDQVHIQDMIGVGLIDASWVSRFVPELAARLQELLDDPNGCQEAAATPLGSTDELAIRSAQVSKVIWLIIGTGAALLFGAIVIRLVRRVRSTRRGPAADPGATS